MLDCHASLEDEGESKTGEERGEIQCNIFTSFTGEGINVVNEKYASEIKRASKPITNVVAVTKPAILLFIPLTSSRDSVRTFMCRREVRYTTKNNLTNNDAS